MTDQIESLRTKLYEVIDIGNPTEILRVSQELDELIIYQIKKNLLEHKLNVV